MYRQKFKVIKRKSSAATFCVGFTDAKVAAERQQNMKGFTTMSNNLNTKNKYWVGVLYNENMVDDWQERIGDLLELPYCYCVHDKDLLSDNEEVRKIHTHVMIAYNNTTTYKNALSVFNKLSKEGKKAINKCEPVHNVKFMYNYLIHDTEDSRKKGKYLYLPTERVCGNNFDIGNYEQLSFAEKTDMAKELCDIIVSNGFVEFTSFYMYVVSNFDSSYFEVIKGYSGLFERLCKGNYLIAQKM